jgi:hypothetical protein
LARVDKKDERGDNWRASQYEHFRKPLEFGHSPSVHSDCNRYPMMEEIILKVTRGLKTRLGKCEVVGSLVLIRSSTWR